MNFNPDQISQIIHGTITQARWIVKPGDRMFGSDLPDVMYDDEDPKEYEWRAVYTAAGRLKWMTERDYAVSPGPGKPGVWWSSYRGIWRLPHDLPFQIDPQDAANTQASTEAELYATFGWYPLRIVITAIRREPLQAISEADAVAEGWPRNEDDRECPHCDALYPTGWYDGPNLPCVCDPVVWYRELWEDINGAGSWDANPDVWVLTFVVKGRDNG